MDIANIEYLGQLFATRGRVKKTDPDCLVAFCICGEPLQMEMEKDEGKCVQCVHDGH